MNDPVTAGIKQLQLMDALHEVLDPETGINLVDLGLIYAAEFDPVTGAAFVRMTLTTPACPAGGVMVEGVERRLMQVADVKSVNVQVVFEPRWTPDLITEDGRAALGW